MFATAGLLACFVLAGDASKWYLLASLGVALLFIALGVLTFLAPRRWHTNHPDIDIREFSRHTGEPYTLLPSSPRREVPVSEPEVSQDE